MWHQDPIVKKWGLSVNQDTIEEATDVLQKIQEILEGKYGPMIRQFFLKKGGTQEMNTPRQIENDDEWFNEDYLDKMIITGKITNDFLKYLKDDENDSDKDSFVSWGTGDTTYTEIGTMVSKDLVTPDSSTITPDSVRVSVQETEDRKKQIRIQLQKEDISREEIDMMLLGKPPYDIIMNGITWPTWSIETTIIMLRAIHNHYSGANEAKENKNTQKLYNKNDEN
jgi:hypothetical protein